MGCLLNWTATGADPRWGLPTLQRVPQGLAESGPALHEALRWRYGTAAPLLRSPASTGGMVRPLWWPLYWHHSGTWVPSPSAAAGPPVRRPRRAPLSVGCS